MQRTLSHSLIAVALITSLAACGGGGGGSSPVPAAPAPAKPNPAAPSTAQQQQQAAVSSAAQETRTDQWRAKYVGTAQHPQQMRRAAARLAAARVASTNATSAPSASPSASPTASPTATPTTQPSSAPCDSNQLTNVTQNIDGSITINQVGYYDACVTLQYQSTLTLQPADPSGKITGSGNETDYDTDGKTVTEYDTTATVIYNANIGSGNMVMQVQRFKDAASKNGAPLDTDYFSELDKAGNVQQLGAASITADPQFPGGQFGSESLYQTTITGGLFQTNMNIAETGTTTNVQDQAGKLAIAQYPLPAGQAQWTINGGHVISATTQTMNASYDTTGVELSYKDTIVDVGDDITTTITGNVGGTQYTGVLTQTSTGTVLAKFVVNAGGNGTITFANGTTMPVQNWCWL